MAADRTHLVTELRLEQQRVAQVEAVLRKALQGVTADLRRIRGGNSIGDQVTESQLKAQKAAIEKRLTAGFKDIEALLAAGQQDAARAASDVVSDQEGSLFRKLGLLDDKAIQILKTSEGQRAANGVEAAIRRIAGQTYKPLSARVYGSQNIASGAVDDIINKGLASGWNHQRLAREIRGSIDPNTPGGASYAAKRLARTEINNAYHASTVARAAATGIVDSMDWNLSSSHPEGDECDTYKEQSPYELKKVPAKPHPQCYCFLTEHLPDEDEFLDNLFAGKYDPEGGFGDDEDSPTSAALEEVKEDLGAKWEADRKAAMAAASAERAKYKYGSAEYKKFDNQFNKHRAAKFDPQNPVYAVKTTKATVAKRIAAPKLPAAPQIELARPDLNNTIERINNAKKPEDVGAALKDHFKNDKITIQGFNKKGVGLRTLDEVKGFAKSVTRQIEETPALRAVTHIKVEKWTYDDKNRAMAWVMQTPNSKGIGTVSLSSTSTADFLEATRRGFRDKFFHGDLNKMRTVDDALDYITTHEMGHLVDSAGRRAAQKHFTNADGAFNMTEHRGHGHDHSAYAHTNASEALAEAYATSRLYPSLATAAEKAAAKALLDAAAKNEKRWLAVIGKRVGS